MPVVLDGPLAVPVHQCTCCGMASTYRSVIGNHLKTRCPGATIQHDKITMCAVDPSQQGAPQAEPKPEPQEQELPNPGYIYLTHARPPATEPAQPNHPDAKSGYVYLVQCPMRVYAKFGRWTGQLEKLKARYSTYYGTPDITAVWCADVAGMERRLKERFRGEGMDLKVRDKRKRELVECTQRVAEVFFEVTGASNSLPRQSAVVADARDPY